MKYFSQVLWTLRIGMGLIFIVSPLSLIQADTSSSIDSAPITMEQLRHYNCDQLMKIFLQAELGKPLEGTAHGKVLVLTDQHFSRARKIVFNTFWQGKSADSEGHLVNRWLGNHQWIKTQYTIGSSWMDQRPAVVVEYAPGTPLFANFRDEIREIAPGLYLALLFERCPSPRLRGIIALQMDCDSRSHPANR